MARWEVKALAVTPGLLISTVVTAMVGSVLPPLAGWALFVGGLSAAVLLLAGVGESAAARVLLFSRPIRPLELDCLTGALTLLCLAGLGPPLVVLRVRPGDASIAAGGIGRRTVVVSAGLLEAVEDGSLPQEQAAAVVAHAAGITAAGLVRHDPLFGFWTLPWQVLSAIGQAVSSLGRRLPLTSMAWRLGGVVITIAVVQNVQLRQIWLAVAIGCIGSISYAMPAWELAWQRLLVRAGDTAVREAGLGQAMAAFLRRCPRTPAIRARLLRLEDTPGTVRPLGLVR